MRPAVQAGGGYYPPLPAYGGAIAALGGSVSLDHVKLAGNQTSGGAVSALDAVPAAASGGAIYNQVNLIAEYCTLAGNSALAGTSILQTSTNGSGGALFNYGNAILDHCSIYSNWVQGSTGTVTSSTSGIGGNGLGGGIFNGGQCSVTNTTIVFNIAIAGKGATISPINGGGNHTGTSGASGDAFGGGIYNIGAFMAGNVTIAANSTMVDSTGQAAGPQIDNNGGTLSLHNSILAYSGSAGNAVGAITDAGFNISSDDSANFEGGSSFNFTDPQLGPLADNGGPTLTMALLATSPAIDFADTNNSPATDQRGYGRPAGAGFDIGAFEYGAVPATTGTWISLFGGTNNSLSFSANAGVTYVLQTSTDLKTWTPWLTNGPFATVSNISQPVSFTNANSRYFRLLMQ